MKTSFNKEYWENKYKQNKTGWDIGKISKPLKAYIDQIQDKNIQILIPGAGNSYEAEYLWQSGFKNITIVDISKQPLINLKTRVPELSDSQLICEDFFSHQGKYDLIIEQTFFCALHPYQRLAYAEKMNKLLNTQGKLVGLLFDFSLNTDGPPFGGSKSEYNKLFKQSFKIKVLAKSYNSIKPRQNRELFFIFEKN